MAATPAMAAMASRLFRMVNSFAMMRAGFKPAHNPANSSRALSFPKNRLFRSRNFRHFFKHREPVDPTSVFYRGTLPQDKIPASIR
jgi:hypothetical protein